MKTLAMYLKIYYYNYEELTLILINLRSEINDKHKKTKVSFAV